jgi:hypothetical protein
MSQRLEAIELLTPEVSKQIEKAHEVIFASSEARVKDAIGMYYEAHFAEFS